MTFRIKFISPEVDGFLRELEIDSDATFLDLARAVLASCGYPDDQMTSFFVCNDEWERGEQITREDMGAGSSADEDVFTMDSTPLTDFIEDEGQNLEFVFDPFSDRTFYMTVKEATPGKHLSEPAVLRAKGDAPRQIEELDFSLPAAGTAGKGGAAAPDEDDLLFGEGAAFNDDELDPEGFEITDGSALY